MLTDEELFESFLQIHCEGRTSQLDASVANLSIIRTTKEIGDKRIASLRQIYGPDLLIPYIGLIDDNALNACAFPYQQRYFIGINAGTVFILHDVFSRMLSHPDLFPKIGDPAKEAQPQPFYDSVTDLRYIDQSDTVTPKGRERIRHAIDLANAALGFLSLHEYGHIMNGHLELRDQLTGQTSFFELEAQATPAVGTVGGMLRQTLEVDADVVGANLGFRALLAQLQYNKDHNQTPSLFYASRENAIYNWMFAVYTLFRLFDQGTLTSDLESLNYPPPFVRAFYIMSTVFTNFQFIDQPEGHLGDVFQQAMLDSERALDTVFFNKPNKAFFTEEGIEATRRHASKLTHNYHDNVQPLLKPYNKWPEPFI